MLSTMDEPLFSLLSPKLHCHNLVIHTTQCIAMHVITTLDATQHSSHNSVEQNSRNFFGVHPCFLDILEAMRGWESPAAKYAN